MVRINPAHVDAGGLESGLALDGANGISRWLRRRRYRARLSENPNALRIVSEGDSDHVPLVMRLVARTDAVDVGGTTSGAAAARLNIPAGATRVDVGFN